MNYEICIKNKSGGITIRAFIGIDFENQLKHEIAELQQKLKKYAVKGRWKYRDNFHLTLKFLDEISSSQREQIDEVMGEICKKAKPFSLGISGLGIFQGRDVVRVLWLGLAGDMTKLNSLYNNIDDAMYSIGFPRQKMGYKPHITIGQDIVFHCSFDEILKITGEVKGEPFNVDRLYLFKSEQVQNKRIYTKVSEYRLDNV